MDGDQFFEKLSEMEANAELVEEIGNFASKAENLLEEVYGEDVSEEDVSQEEFDKACDEAKTSNIISDEDMEDIVNILAVVWVFPEHLKKWYAAKEYAVDGAGLYSVEELAEKYLGTTDAEDEDEGSDDVSEVGEVVETEETEEHPETVLDEANE